MKISTLIERLNELKQQHGDLPVLVSGYEIGWDEPDIETPIVRSLYQKSSAGVCGQYDDDQWGPDQEAHSYLCIER